MKSKVDECEKQIIEISERLLEETEKQNQLKKELHELKEKNNKLYSRLQTINDKYN